MNLSRTIVRYRSRAAYNAAASPAGPAPMMITSQRSCAILGLIQVGFNPGLEVGFEAGGDPGHLRNHGPVLEQMQRGHAHDAVLHRRLAVFVDVDLADLQLPLVLLGDL